MSIVIPDQNALSQISDILDEVNADYVSYLEHNDDEDDFDYLVEMLNELSVNCDLNITWENDDIEKANPGEWLSGVADYAYGKNKISVILWSYNLDGKWGPKTFKRVVLQLIGHETIHLGQYARIGPDKCTMIKSGYQKAVLLKENGGSDQEWSELYLNDPHELMAYGHDLASEIKDSANPEKALRSPEKYISDLPVYGSYRAVFPRNSKPVQKLLSYAARYTMLDD